MTHPIIQKRSNLISYIIVWSMLAALHTLVLWLVYNIPLIFALIHAVVHTLIFALLGLGIWAMVRQNTQINTPGFTVILNHIGAAAVTIFFWIAVSNLIIDSIFSDTPQKNTFGQGSITWRAIIGVFYYAALSLMYYLITAYKSLKDRLKKEADLRALLRESELKALKAQINPHFLFNSLNSISALTFHQSDKARDMIIKLSEFMRYTLKSKDTQLTSLSLEIDNIKKYLDIEKIRFGERLQHLLQLDKNCLNQSVPHLILQPLIENAVKHGVYETLDVNMINITCKKKAEYLYLTIANDIDPDQPKKKGEGLGIQNVKNRLKAQYGERANLTHKIIDNQFIVTLILPLENYE